MTTDDLRARGFTKSSRLGLFFSFCAGPCHDYKFFGWWSEPGATGVKVAACTACGTIEAGGTRYVSRFPILPNARTT